MGDSPLLGATGNLTPPLVSPADAVVSGDAGAPASAETASYKPLGAQCLNSAPEHECRLDGSIAVVRATTLTAHDESGNAACFMVCSSIQMKRRPALYQRLVIFFPVGDVVFDLPIDCAR